MLHRNPRGDAAATQGLDCSLIQISSATTRPAASPRTAAGHEWGQGGHGKNNKRCALRWGRPCAFTIVSTDVDLYSRQRATCTVGFFVVERSATGGWDGASTALVSTKDDPGDADGAPRT